MRSYSLTHLSDQALLRDLTALIARDRATTAALLAHLAEVDVRRLYLPAGYPSMYLYCVQELHLSEDAAYKRIQAARAAREFPALFCAVAEGRLHLSGVCLLAPYLTVENADELLKAAAGKSKSEIEGLLARRFPRSEMLPMVEVLAPGQNGQLAPGQVGGAAVANGQLAPGQVGGIAIANGQLVPEPVEPLGLRSKVAPLAAERYALQVTLDHPTHEQLRYAQALLSHQIPSGDLAQVLARVLGVAIRQLEKQKFGATDRPRRSRRRSTGSARHVPAHVRRAVWQRDNGQCTFVSDDGHRCPSRRFLEFDHVDPVARGGQATVPGMRLRCRAHNQYAAECAFGTEFMRRKRAEARSAAAEARSMAAAEEEARRTAEAEAEARRTAAAEEVIPWLRALGFRADEARRAAALCETIPEASLEERVRVALRSFAREPATSSRGAGLDPGAGPTRSKPQ